MSFNPVRRVFEREEWYGASEPMTLAGTLGKIALLLGTLCMGAAGGIYLILTQSPIITPLLWIAFPSAFVIALVSVFWPHTTKYTAVPYAAFQGIGLGALTLAFESRYPGIAISALSLSSATAVAMLLLYRLEIIKVTDTLRSVIVSATGAIALTYIIVMILGLFGFNTSAFFESSSVTSILFSFFVVGVAAFNLLLDFALIEDSVEGRLPKFMEWYAAFNLLVTLIWLYVEILRLLAKFSRRRD